MRSSSLKISLLLLLSAVLALPGPIQGMMVPHPMALYEQGMAEINAYRGEAERLQRAETAFDTLLKAYPDSPFGYLGMSKLRVVQAYRYDDHYDMNIIRKDALPMAVQALELGASIQEVHEHYSVLEKIYESFGAFQDDIQAALLAKPDDPQTFFKVAEFLCNQGAYRTAIDYYTAALENQPDAHLKVRMQKQLGIIYLQNLHNPDSALKYFNEALSERPQDPVLHEYLGLAYMEHKDYTNAIAELTQSQKLLPTRSAQTQLLKAQGYWFEEQGDLQAAIKQLQRAVKYHALDPVLNFRLGNLYFQTNEYQRAYAHFRRVIDMGAGDPNIYLLAGRSADSLGNQKQAIRYYGEYLQLNGDSQDASWIRAKYPELSQR